ECHFQLGNLEDAKREFEAALAAQLEPAGRLLALSKLGEIASGDCDAESAARYYDEALKLRPHDAAAAYGLGTALRKLGKRELAETMLHRSQVLMQQDDRLADVNELLTKNPGDVKLRLEVARIMVDQGRQADAATWMLSVLRYDPAQRDAHELLAEFYESHGKPDVARRHRNALSTAVAETGAKAAEAAPAAQPPGS
ncbi:MAG TPA: tetratricopeptide repeat protein, partial [Pirellulales bacterium]|nr:tetratricopeptide repeat protein [Pirellulales bacterium]